MADQNELRAGIEPWTPEQQILELKRRMDVMVTAQLGAVTSHEKPSFKGVTLHRRLYSHPRPGSK